MLASTNNPCTSSIAESVSMSMRLDGLGVDEVLVDENESTRTRRGRASPGLENWGDDGSCGDIDSAELGTRSASPARLAIGTGTAPSLGRRTAPSLGTREAPSASTDRTRSLGSTTSGVARSGRSPRSHS